jgi:sugar phosphate isomerase/epimerase
MHICLNTVTAGGGLPLEHFLEVAAKAGFMGADVNLAFGVTHGAAHLADAYNSLKLKYGGWGLPFDWRGDESRQAPGLQTLEAQAKVAAELKIDACCTWIMSSSDRPFMDNWNFHLARLQPAAKILANHGLRLGLEFLGPYHIRHRAKHEFLFTPGQMLELCDAVGENTGLLVDIFHAFTSNTPYDEIAKLPAKRIVWVHLNDAPNLPLNQQIDSHRLLPGEGIADCKGFLKAIAATGYSGPVSVEVFNADLKKMPAQEAADKAWGACKTLLPLPAQA